MRAHVPLPRWTVTFPPITQPPSLADGTRAWPVTPIDRLLRLLPRQPFAQVAHATGEG